MGPAINADYHALRFRRRAGTSDLSYVVQVSTNLTTWAGSATEPQTVEVDVRPLGNDMEEVTARTVYAVSGLPQHFMRLTVTLAP